jgi:hypothetical protein
MPAKSVIERINDRGSYGFCRIEILAASVHAQCEWPLDREFNESFKFTMTFPHSTWEQALETLGKHGKAEILDSNENLLSLTNLDRERVALEMTKGRGPLSKSLYLDRPFTLSELLSLEQSD